MSDVRSSRSGQLATGRSAIVHVWIVAACWAGLMLVFLYAATVDWGALSGDTPLFAAAAAFGILSAFTAFAGRSRIGFAISGVCAVPISVWLGLVAVESPASGFALPSLIGVSLAVVAAIISFVGARSRTT